MVLRLSSEKLIQKNQLFYYQDTLFSGVMYVVEGREVKAIKELQNGRVVGDFKDPYLPEKMPDLRLLDEVLKGDWDEPICLQGKPLTAIVYTFNDGFCVSQTELDFGQRSSETDFLKDGTPYRITYFEDELGIQQFEWTEKGKLIHYRVTLWGSLAELSLKGEEDGSLHSIIVKNNFFELIKPYKNWLIDKSFSEKEYMSTLTISRNVYLSGNSVSLDILISIFENGGFRECSQVYVSHDMSIDMDLIKFLTQLNLNRLDFTEQNYPNDTLLQLYTSNAPTCEVYIGNQLIAS
ncbi:hypothetical protein [Catenovulum sediminis]|uniref:hypothetical protein n=1 Tax=Catenovulum sediminis TaxID=1740262 RepID=UPI00117D9D43|nr:hypothetical protein [Catenovulum sediminis]